jgi:hypothetical protein
MGLQVERLETRRALHAMLASLGDDGCVSAIAPKHGCATTGRREVRLTNMLSPTSADELVDAWTTVLLLVTDYERCAASAFSSECWSHRC